MRIRRTIACALVGFLGATASAPARNAERSGVTIGTIAGMEKTEAAEAHTTPEARTGSLSAEDRERPVERYRGTEPLVGQIGGGGGFSGGGFSGGGFSGGGPAPGPAPAPRPGPFRPPRQGPQIEPNRPQVVEPRLLEPQVVEPQVVEPRVLVPLVLRAPEDPFIGLPKIIDNPLPINPTPGIRPPVGGSETFYVIGDPSVEPMVPPMPHVNPVGDALDDHFDLPGTDSPDTRRVAMLDLATVLITSKNAGGNHQVCSGSYLGNGLVLTAHHCHLESQGAVEFNDFRVLFGPLTAADRTNGKGIAAQVVPDLPPAALSRDFLLLALDALPPKAYRKAVVRLSKSHPWQSGPEKNAPLESVLIWENGNDADFGKKRSADDQCVAVKSSQTARHCLKNRYSFKHKCDSTRGSSGAPLFRRGGSAVVAIHVAGNVPVNPDNTDEAAKGHSNCALPTATIFAALSESSAKHLLEGMIWVD